MCQLYFLHLKISIVHNNDQHQGSTHVGMLHTCILLKSGVIGQNENVIFTKCLRVPAWHLIDSYFRLSGKSTGNHLEAFIASLGQK